MEEVAYILDTEGGVDASDPLGILYFKDSKGNSIFIKNTYIDAWLMAIGDFLLTLKKGRKRIEILEESEFIDAVFSDNNLRLTYNGVKIFVDSRMFYKNVCGAIALLIEDLSSISILGETKNTVLLREKLIVLKNRNSGDSL